MRYAALGGWASRTGGLVMSVAKVIELTSTSAKSFEDAIQKGIARQNAQERRGRVDQGAESHRDGRQDQWLPRQHVGDFRARRGDVDLATFATILANMRVG